MTVPVVPKAPTPVQAQDIQAKNSKTFFPVSGAPATFPNVLFAAIKHGGLDMSEDDAIDDFAKVEYCDIYRQYHDNEFDWRKVRSALRKKIQQDKVNYPDTLYLERPESFGAYDFSSGMLPLNNSSVMKTRALQLADVTGGNYCGVPLKILPNKFVALLDKPVVLDGIELSEDEARTVIAELNTPANEPQTRLAYGRYTITFTDGDEKQTRSSLKLDARLDNVTMYEDADYSRPFWSGQSSPKIYHAQEGVIDKIPFKGIDATEEQQADPEKPIPSVTPH